VNPCDNARVLCQDCSRPLFRWFLTRIDWRRILKLLDTNQEPRQDAARDRTDC